MTRVPGGRSRVRGAALAVLMTGCDAVLGNLEDVPDAAGVPGTSSTAGTSSSTGTSSASVASSIASSSSTPSSAASSTLTSISSASTVGSTTASTPSTSSTSSTSSSSTGGAPVPQGTTLMLGSGISLDGVTNDGFVVYDASDGVWASPVGGGTPKQLSTSICESEVVSNNVVFIWDGPNCTGLSMWTSPGPTVQLSMTSVQLNAAASADSSEIVYMTEASADGSTAKLVGARAASPTTFTVLAKATGLLQDACAPVITFSAANVVLQFCPMAEDTTEDAGDDSLSVWAYPSSTWKGTMLASDTYVFYADATGKYVALSFTGNGELEIATDKTGATVGIRGADVVNTSSFYLSQSDAFVLSAAGALASSPVETSAPTTLVSAGVHYIDNVSPDERWAIVSDNQDTDTLNLLDMSLASTVTAGPATLLTSSDGLLFAGGDAFTADSTYALFMTHITMDANGDSLGPLVAFATSGSGTGIPVASASISPYESGSGSDFALGGSRVVFSDQYDAHLGANGAVNLEVIDLAAPAGVTTVMSGADPYFLVSADRQYILYTVNYMGNTDGIYSLAAPAP